VEFYNGKGLLKHLTVTGLKQIDGYWVATTSRMENVVKKHATVLEVLDQKNNLDFPADFFSTRNLKKTN